MLAKHKIIILIFVGSIRCSSFQDLGSGTSNFIFDSFTDCAKKTTPIKFSFIPKLLNKTYQVLDGYMDIPTSLGNNFMTKISGKLLIHNKWVPIGNLSDTFCRGLRNYVGPLRTDIMGAIGLSADTCPIPAGHYHWKNLHLDFQKSRLPVFPYGKFDVTVALYEITTNILNICLDIQLENKLS